MDEFAPTTVGGRVKAVRKALELTQDEFCAGLTGVTRANIAGIEIGRSLPSDLVLLRICDHYHTTMDYLKEGKLPMFPKRTASDQIIDFANTLIKPDADPFARRFVLALASLGPREWEVLNTIAKQLAEEPAPEQ